MSASADAERARLERAWPDEYGASLSANSASRRRRRMTDLRALWPHQARAIEELRRSLQAGHRRPMLQAPTGFGKTLTAAQIIQRALDKGKSVAFTVPSINLIDQTVAAFEAEGIHCLGVLQGAHPRTDREAPVQICSVQTLTRRKRLDVDLVLVDEAHGLYRDVLRWMADCPSVPFVGLSATPWSRGLGQILRRSHRRRDDGRSHRRRLSLAVHRLCAEQSGPQFRLDRRRRLQGGRAFGSDGPPGDHRRYRRRVAQARRGSADLGVLRRPQARPPCP